jgi:glycosyltransferase involved in cell wall biosynthesis
VNLVFLAPFAFAPKATVSARMLPMATALVRLGHRVTILIPPYDHPADSGSAWERDGVQLENARLPASHLQSRIPTLSYLSLARQLARRARQLRPDALHVFKPVGPGALALWMLSTAGLVAGRPPRIVVDNDDWEGRGGWLDVNPYPALQKRVMAWQERWCLRQAAAVTCASHVLVERTRRLAGARVPTLLLPNGPDRSLRDIVARAEARRAEARAQFGWGAQPVLIYAGTVPLNHDLDLAVRAVADLRAAGRDLRWVIVASGDGLPSLQQAVRDAGLGAVADFHAFMPHDRLVELLVAADIAVYPYRDTPINRAKCSGKVVDYMACGKPMVVSDVGMNREYVAHGRSGLLTPPGDAPAFRQALAALLADPEGAARMGRAAQDRVWDLFDWDRRAGMLEAVYRA